MMKIAHVVWGLGTGGVETMLVDIVNIQIETEEVKVYVINAICDENVVNKIDTRVDIIYCNREIGSKNFFPIIKFNIMLIKYNPDIIHCHYSNLAKLFFSPHRKLVTIHNTQSEGRDFHKFDYLFCISKAVKKDVAQKGYPNGCVVYNGIHVDKINHRPKGIFANTKEKRFVCIGRLYKDKGQWLLVEAINELVNVRGLSDFSIDFIGEGEDYEMLQKRVIKYGLTEKISFLGIKPREYFYPLLCEYDLLILPSISEGFGLVLAEAAAAKVPIITCDLEGPMEVINNGDFGISFKTGDSKDLADVIERFLNEGKDTERVENAYHYVLENFDIRKTSIRYIEEYRKILSLERK